MWIEITVEGAAELTITKELKKIRTGTGKEQRDVICYFCELEHTYQ